jgi:hypothetical protein
MSQFYACLFGRAAANLARMAEEVKRLTFATILLAAIGGLAGFALLLFIGGVLASIAAGPLHISPMEGASGYFAVAIGLTAGVLGFIGAVWFVLRRRGIRGGGIVLGGVMEFAIIIFSAASAVGIWYAMQPHALNLNGPEPLLRVELRAPENFSPDAFGDISGELSTDRNGADLVLDKPDVATPLIRHGYVPLYFRTSHRLLELKLADGSMRLFNVRLPANPMPKKYHVWTEWQKPDFIDQPGSSAPNKASGALDIEVRYRVEVAGD